jgi:glycine/D-amino acid oxidase-like deaminating enzyme
VPNSAEVLVIGGGIVGVSTAWFLARQGVNVVLCEKGHIAGEQSGRNWGWVRIQGRDTREIPMMQAALDIWDGLQEATGEDVGFVRRGCFFTADSEKEMASFENWVKIARDYGIDSRLIAASELKQHVQSPMNALTAVRNRNEQDQRSPGRRNARARQYLLHAQCEE